MEKKIVLDDWEIILTVMETGNLLIRTYKPSTTEVKVVDVLVCRNLKVIVFD